MRFAAAAACTVVGVLIGGLARAAEPLPMDDFIKHQQFIDVKISPTGEYLAATILATEDTGALVILRRGDQKMTGTMKLRGRALVQNFFWVNDERIVLSVAEAEGSLSAPSPTGEIYATNFDGTKQELLIGGRKQGGLEAAKRKQKFEGAFIIDPLRDDDKHIIVSVFRPGSEDGTYPSIERLNVYTGGRKVLARAPVLNARYATDAQGRVRFAVGSGKDNRTKTYYRADDDAEWQLMNDEAVTDLAATPVGFTPDGAKAYLEWEEKQGPNAIYRWDPKSGARELIARDDNVDPLSIVTAHDDATIYGVAFMDGKPKLQLVDEDVPEASVHASLISSFPGQWVSVRSYTKDGKELVFRVTSDRNPGDFYLLDKSNKATYLLSTMPWIKPETMGVVKPVQYTARDGLVIHGYLTLPPGSDGKNLPLVVNPHGGPFGPFDDWMFNWEAQLLASRGYAVLQPNFRGSGNYGRAFVRTGYQDWGGKMQDDLTDATQWAIKEGIADKNRVCIYGGSYGGYASAMGIAKEPDLYRCAIGYVGVYDMEMMYTRGDIQQADSGVNFLKEALGGGRENLKARSPNYLADRIKAPIFIASGGKDVRAPAAHSKALRDALEKAGKPYEWLLNPNEGHGFYQLDSRREFYGKMIEFLDKYIGQTAAP
jgi:dipeptidyl aminopeptidase/acylaminoacyl peptidase